MEKKLSECLSSKTHPLQWLISFTPTEPGQPALRTLITPFSLTRLGGEGEGVRWWVVAVLSTLPTTCCNKSGIPRQSIRSVASGRRLESVSGPLACLTPTPPPPPTPLSLSLINSLRTILYFFKYNLLLFVAKLSNFFKKMAKPIFRLMSV